MAMLAIVSATSTTRQHRILAIKDQAEATMWGLSLHGYCSSPWAESR